MRINLIPTSHQSGMAARLGQFVGIGKDYPRGCRGTKQSGTYNCLGMLCLPLLAPNSLVDNFFFPQITSNSKEGFTSVNDAMVHHMHMNDAQAMVGLEPQEWRNGVVCSRGKAWGAVTSHIR